MFWTIAVFVYMNIGIFWGLHRGDVDWSDVDEKIFAQIHMVLWPLSMMLNFGHDLYLWNKKRNSQCKTKGC